MNDDCELQDAEAQELSSLSQSVLKSARAQDPSPEAIAALRRALAPQLGGGGGGSAPPRVRVRMWTSVAGGAALVLWIGWVVWPRPEVDVQRAPVEVPTVATPEVIAPVVAPPAPVDVMPPEQPAPPHGRSDDAQDEPAYIDAVQRALNTQPSRALRLAQRHHARFPDGLLGEEAEVLEIEARARLGQSQEAQASALSFYARHPASPYRRRIDRALTTPE